MELLIHKHLLLRPQRNRFGVFNVPLWEIELRGPELESEDFELCLKNHDNYRIVPYGVLERRSYQGQSNDSARQILDRNDFKHTMLDLAGATPEFESKFRHPIDWYKDRTHQFSAIIFDQPGFEMTPHIDNHDIVIQCVVNLVKDYETCTEFYHSDHDQPFYQAPLKKNHGVMFLNTAGAIHGIRNITEPRWIWYSGISMTYQQSVV